jgi:carbon-monoxide dehydrogenase medium subunit
MKPCPFEYICPDSVEETVQTLASSDDAKLLAGGQSLIPMMNFRVVRPALLIDIGKLIELDYVRPQADGGLEIGALTRHRTLETSQTVASRYPILPEAMKHVAHLAIRTRGTLGGSLSHSDPATELPMLSLLLGASITAVSGRGRRVIAARNFFLGPLTNALGQDEMLRHISVPSLSPGTGWAFEEVNRRAGDFALACAGVLIERDGDTVRSARIAMMGVGETPLLRDEAAAMMKGERATPALFEAVTHRACEGLAPAQDLHASPDFRRHLAAVLTRRALHAAWHRAGGTTR